MSVAIVRLAYQRVVVRSAVQWRAVGVPITIYRVSRRVRLRKPVFGNRYRTESHYTVTVDRKLLKDGRRAVEFAKLAEAKTAAAVQWEASRPPVNPYAEVTS